MKKLITSNPKISHALMYMIFSILFIFTALNISNPIPAYAYTTVNDAGGEFSIDFVWDPVTRSWVYKGTCGESGEDGIVIPESIGKDIINGTSTVGSVAPAYTYWAGDSYRCGVICYVIDLSTNTRDHSYTPFILVHGLTDTNLDPWQYLVNAHKFYLRTGDTLVLSQTKGVFEVESIQPVVYAGGSWSSNAAAVKSDLLSEDATYKYQMFKYWARYGSLSNSQISQLARDISSDKKALAFETVSAQSFFTSSDPNSFEELYGMGTGFNGFTRVGDESTNHEGMMVRCFTTEYGFAKYYNSKGISGLSGSTHNWKWFQSTAGSMMLEEDEAGLVVPSGNTSIGSITSSEASTIANGYGIIITHISLPPIHTFDGTNTPGNTELPSPDNQTDGYCTIKKLYYTQIIASDGTILTEATDYHPYTRTLTTNYISIDNEEGYESEGWKTSTSDKAFTQKSHYDGILPVKQSGTSSDVITLDETTDEKYLYVLLKKTEIETNPPDPWDFQLKQSQITKRVTFLESSGPANTPDLIIHNFKWTAPAPAITSCIAHGGDGHKYNHSCGYGGYSCSTWYTHPCSSFQWTDNTTKLGIKIDTTALNKAVVSKNHEVTYNATTVNTIESDVTHMGLFFFAFFLDIADNLEFQIKPSI